MPYGLKSNSRFSPTVVSENQTAISALHLETALCHRVVLSESYTCNIKRTGRKKGTPTFALNSSPIQEEVI